jgi:hypothetical protein
LLSHARAECALASTLLSRIKSPAVWPGFFLFGKCGDYFPACGNVALSNPTELINLRRIAEPESGLPQVAFGQ